MEKVGAAWEELPRLQEEYEGLRARKGGPAGLALLRGQHCARFPALDPNKRLHDLLSIRSRSSGIATIQQAGQRELGLGVDRFKWVSCPLNEGEVINDLKLVSPTIYLLSTTQSRLFAVNILSHARRVDLSVPHFERSLDWAGSVWSAVFGSKTVPVRSEGGERFLVEQYICAGVLEAMAGEKIGNEQWALHEGEVETVDAAVTASGHLAVLISHVHDGSVSVSLSFAIVMLELGTSANSVVVAGLTHLTYQSRPDPRSLSTPRLSLGSGEIAFVVFADAVVIASIALTAPGTEGYETRRLQTRIEQAVFFGTAEAQNPLALDLQPDFEVDLAVAAVAVSSGILASSSANMPLILDLRAQLADRVHRAKALMECINVNKLLGKFHARLGPGSSILSDAILQYMDEIGEGWEDPLRLFFRTKVSGLGNMLEEVTRRAKHVFSTSSPRESVE
ncbi:hypothetical protein JCM10296v2_001686 [Rhodotorula toruloides]